MGWQMDPWGQTQTQHGRGTPQEGSGSVDWFTSTGMRPVPEDLQPYGTGPFIPNNWTRHRLSYPRDPSPVLQRMTEVPINSPAFPKNDLRWLYRPPADEDL
jgi:hypothetical protein